MCRLFGRHIVHHDRIFHFTRLLFSLAVFPVDHWWRHTIPRGYSCSLVSSSASLSPPLLQPICSAYIQQPTIRSSFPTMPSRYGAMHWTTYLETEAMLSLGHQILCPVIWSGTGGSVILLSCHQHREPHRRFTYQSFLT